MTSHAVPITVEGEAPRAEEHDHPQSAPIALRRMLRLARPRTEAQLHAYVRLVLGFQMPRRALVPGHDAPFAYLAHAFFEDRRPRDCLVWANRGGGKTQLGAIATLLDMLFKPGIQVRILAGSFDQSSKMYRYLRTLLDDDALVDLVAGSATGRALELRNGSRVEVLSQSERSVRGQRVHKLRCDEVELFEPEIWEAAQLVTRSGDCGGTHVRGAIEAFSTMHRPFGMMQRLLREAESAGRRVFKWNLIDTLARCEPERACHRCPLEEDCGGSAKHARGFISIDDAIQQRARVGGETWSAEMLCNRPNRSDSVYPEFDLDVHVAEMPVEMDGEAQATDKHAAARDLPSPPGRGAGGEGCPAVDDQLTDQTRRLRSGLVKTPRDGGTLPAPTSGGGGLSGGGGTWLAGLDFGFRSPTVLLLARHDAADDSLYIEDELIETERTAEEVIEAALARGWPEITWIGADPAGHQRNDQTGLSTIALWKDAGFTIRARRIAIEAGIRAVRRRLCAADGAVRLRIHPRCETLIRSLVMYHYPANRPDVTVPVKDGMDHAADALRYLVINLDRGDWAVTVRRYQLRARP